MHLTYIALDKTEFKKYTFILHAIVTGEKKSDHHFRGRGSNPGRMHDRPTLFHVAIIVDRKDTALVEKYNVSL